MEIVKLNENETIENITFKDDFNKEIQLEKGRYKITSEAKAANGKITTDIKTITLNEDILYSLHTMLFDKNHRFYQKLK
ncbi:hypothetical protein [Metabacillus fastidiosus]|uniref:hypothetical protein n=1 Tax=Metabacillus fastidiosus TaxID=1458 RepID=UPI000826A036|nr:hypothetical protein [Metabacillus fastidiosus]MED4462703.1 hypothetical protein [Metabacillus fastidiosus]